MLFVDLGVFILFVHAGVGSYVSSENACACQSYHKVVESMSVRPPPLKCINVSLFSFQAIVTEHLESPSRAAIRT